MHVLGGAAPALADSIDRDRTAFSRGEPDDTSASDRRQLTKDLQITS